jgi:hypothetical protein
MIVQIDKLNSLKPHFAGRRVSGDPLCSSPGRRGWEGFDQGLAEGPHDLGDLRVLEEPALGAVEGLPVVRTCRAWHTHERRRDQSRFLLLCFLHLSDTFSCLTVYLSLA